MGRWRTKNVVATRWAWKTVPAYKWVTRWVWVNVKQPVKPKRVKKLVTQRYKKKIAYKQAYNKRTPYRQAYNRRVKYKQYYNKRTPYRQAYNRRVKYKHYYNKRQAYKQRYTQRYTHGYSHRAVSGWRYARKGSRTSYVTTNAHHEVTFSVIPRRRVRGWSNLLHVTGTNRNCCGWADRVPAVFIYSNSSRMHIRDGHSKSGNHGLDPPNQLPWNRVSHVRIRSHGNRLCVWIWGATRYSRCIGQGTRRWGGRAHFYVSDPWYAQAGMQISNVWYRHMNGVTRYRNAKQWATRWAWRNVAAYRTAYKNVVSYRTAYRTVWATRTRYRWVW